MGSKSKSKSSSSQKVRPTGDAKNNLDKLFGEVNKVYDTTPKSYDGQLVAGFDPLQTQGQEAQLAQAQGLSTGADALRSLGLDTAQGKYLDFNTAPLADYFGALQQQQRREFDENQSRVNQQQAIQSGAYGGSRQGVQQAISERQFNEVLQERQAQVALQNYLAERQLQQGAGNLLGQANSLALAPGQLQQQIGALRQQQQQRELQGQLQRFDLNRNLQWQDAINYSNILQQHNPTGFGYDSSSQSKSSSQTKDPVGAIKGVAGLALGAAALAGTGGAAAPLLANVALQQGGDFDNGLG